LTGVAGSKDAWVLWRLWFCKASEADALAAGSSSARVTSDGGDVVQVWVGSNSNNRGAINQEQSEGED